ncbi:MAG TPA: Imm1 family immunity protein [Blastocatellia bacterium]|nr:Imm1 family immunity protein [Blastocatellia bacterium]HNG33701.1 Imm1 family immunity protein [Blastocatellia bacterium]
METSVLVIDQWQGNLNEEKAIADPKWKDIESAIKALDGKRHTMVTIKNKANNYLIVGGGKGNKYVVIATFDNQSFYNLVTGLNGKTERLVVGGQIGDYPSNMCVTLDTTLNVSKTYFENNELDTSAIWQLDA